MAEESKLWMYFVLSTLATIMSLTLCCWYAIVYLRLAARLRSRLFPQQMLCMACADAILALSLLGKTIVQFIGGRTGICESILLVVYFSRYLSLFFEIHIAFSFCCASFRFIEMLKCMPRLLWIAIFPSITCTLVEAFAMGEMEYTKTFGCHNGASKWIAPVVVAFSGLLCLCFYALTAVQASKSPGTFSNVLLCRMWCFILGYVISWVPSEVVWIVSWFYSDNNYATWSLISRIFEQLSGFSNVIVYYCRWRRVSLDRSSLDLCDDDREGGKVSFHVLLLGESVMEIPAETAEAMRQSEADMRRLERGTESDAMAYLSSCGLVPQM